MATTHSMGSCSDCATGGDAATGTDSNEDRQALVKQRSVGVLRSLDVQPFASMRIHHVQLTRSPTAANKLASSSRKQQCSASSAASTPLFARLHLLWKLNAWLIFATSLLFCIARVSAGASKGSSKDGSVGVGAGRSFPAHSDWYIVLVSIPVLDKVLPLKHLAEELLYRGYRVGFALPEVCLLLPLLYHWYTLVLIYVPFLACVQNCRQWVSDIERLEFVSLGNIVGKGRGNYLELEELSTIGVYESYAATLRYYASFQRPMFGALVEHLEDDRPNLVIVDRYTFAGLDAAHALQLPYVVNDPHLLLDMDSPPAYIPAPFSNYSMHVRRFA